MSAALRWLGAWLLALAGRLDERAVQASRYPGGADLRAQERLFELRARIHCGYY